MKKVYASAIICVLSALLLTGCGAFVKSIPQGQIPDKTPADQFVTIHGINIHYKEYPASGHDVFMLHGLPSSMYTWEKVAPILQKNGFHVWLMDMKGFGWSDKPAESNYDIETLTSEVNDFLEAKGLHDVYFVGNSFGGGIATVMAIEHPDKMDKLVLVDAAGYPQKLPLIMQLGKIPLAGKIMKMMYGMWMIKWNLGQVMYAKEDITEDQLNAYYDRIRSDGAMDALIGMVQGIDFSKYTKFINRVATIKIPTLIVWGDTDRWVPIESGCQLKKNIKDATFVEINSCGHMPQEEKPDLTAELFMNFFTDKPIKSPSMQSVTIR